MSEGLILHPSRHHLDKVELDELVKLVEEKGKNPYAPGKKRDDDFDKLVRLGEDTIELVLANAKSFSEALSVLGVGRKTFLGWVEREPSRKEWMGRVHTRPLWER